MAPLRQNRNRGRTTVLVMLGEQRGREPGSSGYPKSWPAPETEVARGSNSRALFLYARGQPNVGGKHLGRWAVQPVRYPMPGTRPPPAHPRQASVEQSEARFATTGWLSS